MQMTIDRKVWLRGEGNNRSYLLREDGKRCCVGIFLSALGLGDEDLHGMRSAADTRLRQGLLPELAGWLVIKDATNTIDTDTSEANTLYDVNDDINETSAVREIRVAEVFARHGVEVEFVG